MRSTMAATLRGLVLTLTLLGGIGGVVGITQDDINYIGRNLEVKYKVIDNIKTTKGFTFRISLTNTGPNEIASGESGWSLYFNHIRMIEPDDLMIDGGTYTRREGTVLGDYGLRLYHVNGVLFRMTPTEDFKGITPGATLDLDLFGRDWQVARTDVMPNWYVVGPDDEPTKTEPVILASTADESLQFVEDLTTREQTIRTTWDQYSPYSLEKRFEMFSEVGDLGKAPLRVLPNVVKQDLDDSETVDITTGGWSIVADSESLDAKAKFLSEKIGLPVAPKSKKPSIRFVLLKIDPKLNSGEFCKGNSETYTLETDAEKLVITITGREEVGVFWGIQTLLSLTHHDHGRIPRGQIEDCPRFGYRGMHTDVARNFFSKSTILKLLDVMAMYKLNKFHFHLTDDEGWRIEIPGIPELTTVGASRCHDLTGDHCIMPQLGAAPGIFAKPGSGYYTVDDYKEILTYAKERHIEVIPEFDMPGHAHAAINALNARYRKYKDVNPTLAEEFLLVDLNDTSKYLSIQTFIDNAMDPCLESTYNFIQHVIVKMKEIHRDIQPLRVFHYGGDEVPRTAWLNSTACAESSLAVDSAQLKKYFAQRVSKMAADEGLDLAAWEDGLMDRSEHQPFNLSELESDTVYSYAWNNVWEWGSGARTYRMANLGYKMVISHATNFYFDHPNEPDPEERGYYWATRWTNVRKTFGFAPDSVYDNMDYDLYGRPINKTDVCLRYGCPELESKENVVGIQGQLWSETVRTDEQYEAMVFPRLLALAERAWHKAAWEDKSDPEKRSEDKNKDWESFSNLLGYKELLRLDEMDGPVQYHLLPPGAKLDGNKLSLRVEFPGLKGQVSEDDGMTWTDVRNVTEVNYDTTITVITRSADYKRMSRRSTLEVGPAPTDLPGSSSPVHFTYSQLILLSLLLAGILTM